MMVDLPEHDVQRVTLTPRPDPSALTTDALRTAIADMRERLEGAVETRRHEVDQVEKTLTALIEGVHGTFTAALAGEVRIVEERFKSVDLRFTERDVRTEQAATAGASALAAALQAAKELVGAQGEASAAAAVKSETAFTKQIDQITALIQTGNAASDARITELKERIDRGEGSASGSKESRTDARASTSVWVAAAGAFLFAISLAISIVPLILGK